MLCLCGLFGGSVLSCFVLFCLCVCYVFAWFAYDLLCDVLCDVVCVFTCVCLLIYLCGVSMMYGVLL